MARDLLRELNEGFQEFRATTEDDDGDEHESTTRAFVVPPGDRDFAQLELLGSDGQARRIGKDSVVTETSRPGVYDVTPKAEWDKLGYSAKSGDAPKPAAPVVDKPTDPKK
jgi:hypothetical protein